MKKLLLIPLFLLLAASVHGQSYVAVNLGATYSNGSLIAQLLPPSNGNVGITHTFLDANGATVIYGLLGGRTYGFWASKGDGSALLYGRVTVTGAPQDVTAALLTVGGGGSGNPAAPPNSAQYNNAGVFGGTLGVVTGFPYVAQNSAPPAFLTPKLLTTTIAGTTDTLLCDSATTIQDRMNMKKYTSAGGITVTVPDVGDTGCGVGTAFLVEVVGGASNGVFNRETASTFNLLNSGTTGQTTFTLPAGQTARITASTSSTWDVVITSGSGSGVTLSGVNCNDVFQQTTSSLVTSPDMFFATCYGGAPDAQLNSCASAALSASGGCIATGLAGTTAVTTQISIGDNAEDAVAVQVPYSGNMTTTINSSSNCAFKQWDNTDVSGAGLAGNSTFRFIQGSTASDNFIYCNDTAGAGGTKHYMHLQGVGIFNPSTGAATASGAGMIWQNLSDNSIFEKNEVFDDWDAFGARFVSLCCGSALDHSEFNTNMGPNGGGTPLSIESGQGFSTNNSAMVHPGAGSPIVRIIDNTGANGMTHNFVNDYCENNATDTTTTLFPITGGPRAINFLNLTCHPIAANSNPTIISLSNNYNTMLSVRSLSLGPGVAGSWTCPNTAAIVNNKTGWTVPTDAFCNIADYESAPAYYEQLNVLGNYNMLTQTSGQFGNDVVVTTPSGGVSRRWNPTSGTANAAYDYGDFRLTNAGTNNACRQIFNADGTATINTQLCGLNGANFINVGGSGIGFGTTSNAFYMCWGLAATCPMHTDTLGNFATLTLGLERPAFYQTAPTVSSGFGTSPSIQFHNGTAAFSVNVGTGGVATSGVIGLPTSTNGWACHFEDTSTNSSTVFITKVTAKTASSVTIGNFNTSGAAAAWVASDILTGTCAAY